MPILPVTSQVKLAIFYFKIPSHRKNPLPQAVLSSILSNIWDNLQANRFPFANRIILSCCKCVWSRSFSRSSLIFAIFKGKKQLFFGKTKEPSIHPSSTSLSADTPLSTCPVPPSCNLWLRGEPRNSSFCRLSFHAFFDTIKPYLRLTSADLPHTYTQGGHYGI